MDPGDEVLALQHLDLEAAEAHVVARVARIQHLVAGVDAGDVAPTAVTIPVRQGAASAADAGRMSPARVSASSETGCTTTNSSSGSSETSTLRDSSITL